MRRPLRFLHISTFYPPWSFGGDAMYIYRLARALADDGHEVDVVHSRAAYRLLHREEPPVAIASYPGVRVHDVSTRFGALGPLLAHQAGRPLLERRRLVTLLAERRPDVVHFHNISLLGPSVLSLAAPGVTPLKIYTAHEHWLVCPTHVLWKHQREVCVERECLRCTLRHRRPPQLWRATGHLEASSRHVHQFIAPSRFVVRSHAERGFAPPMAPLPLFVEDARDDIAAPAHPRPYMLFVGRLEKIKGLQTVIPLWRRIEGIDLVVAGAGDFEPDLRRMAAGDPRIRFLGHVSQADLQGWYQHAMACIVPSVTFETFGIIVIEAFRHGTPVIARDLGSLPEIVAAGGGVVYGDDDGLVQAVERLRDDADERERLSARAREAFRTHWSTEAHLRAYYALLHDAAIRAFGRAPWEA
jgi:glycosyltransferase involved in cell wall biosynthesis